MYNKKIINFFSILLILIMLFLTIVLKIKKHKAINYVSQFTRDIDSIIEDSNTKTYNFPYNSFSDSYQNKIILLNVYDINDPNFLNGVSIAEYLSNKYQNISIFDFILKDNNKEIDIYSLIENNVEDFIKKYSISRSVIYTYKNLFLEKLNIDDINNKIIILDEDYNIKNIFDSNINVEKIEDILKDIKIRNISFELKNSNKEISQNQNDYKSLITSMNKMIVLDGFNNFNFPVFAVLDSSAKNILIIKIDGEILYILDCNNMCLPSGIKYSDNKLFITDSCDSSIRYFDFDTKKLEILFRNPNLNNISDFEFIDNENILISKSMSNGVGIFNGQEYVSLNENLGLDYLIRDVKKIIKHDDKYYYFDENESILYSYNKNENIKQFDFNEVKSVDYGKIIGFYINSENDIYFLDKINHKILRLYNDNIYEDSFKDNVFSPNDFLIYKNIFFVLSDEYIQMFDIYYDKQSQIIPYCSSNTEYVGDILSSFIFSKSLSSMDRGNFKIENILGQEKLEILKPSFLMLFKEQNNKLYLQKLIDYRDINSVSLIDKEISYIFGKLYYIQDGKIVVRSVDYKIFN